MPDEKTAKMSDLPKSSLDMLDEMLGRFCPAQGSHSLQCAKSRGHDGPHYDVVRALEWGSATDSASTEVSK